MSTIEKTSLYTELTAEESSQINGGQVSFLWNDVFTTLGIYTTFSPVTGMNLGQIWRATLEKNIHTNAVGGGGPITAIAPNGQNIANL